MATQPDTLEILDLLTSAFGVKDFDEKLIRAWCVAFQQIPRLWLARHATKWVETEGFFPKISDIRYRIDQEMRGMTRGGANWAPPKDKRDEAAMWLCFIRGIGPDELTVKDLLNLPPEEVLIFEPEEIEVEF